MSFEFFVAKKYFSAKRQTGFISIITFVSIAGVTIGVTALILVLSVMNGFEDEVRSKIINADAHIRLRKFFTDTIEEVDKLIKVAKENPRVKGASPTIYEKGMIQSKHSKQPSGVKAIDIESIDQISDIRQYMVLGDLDFEPKVIDGQKLYGIILGKYLADALISSNINDKVTLMALPKTGGLFAQPRVMQFYVAGIVEFGYYEYDRMLSYISLETGQKLFNMPTGVSWIEIKLDDYKAAQEVAEEIESKLGYPYTTLTWRDMNKSLFSWMEIEKWGMFVILSLIIMVAAFNIISSLIMIVMEKTREIGILKSMGATSKNIMKIFMFEGVIIGIIGTVIGNIIGYSIGFLQLNYKIISLPADVYIIDSLPIQMQFIDFIAI